MTDKVLTSCKEYEKAISEYTGLDPLDLWHRYVEAMVAEENILLPDVIIRASSVFFNQTQYVNDLRWYDILYRHAEIHEDPMKFYMSIYKHTKVCRQPAELFIRWSQLYKQNSDEYRSQIILKQALAHNVREKDWIKKLLGNDDSKKTVIQYFPELSEISSEEVKAEKYLKSMKIKALTAEIEELKLMINKSDSTIHSTSQNAKSVMNNIFNKTLNTDGINGFNDDQGEIVNMKSLQKINLPKEKKKNFEIYTDEVVQEVKKVKKEKFSVFHDNEDMDDDVKANKHPEKNQNVSIVARIPVLPKQQEIDASEMYENDFEMSIIGGSHKIKEIDIDDMDSIRFNPNIQSTMKLPKLKEDTKDEVIKTINKNAPLLKDLSKICEENTQSTFSSNGSRAAPSMTYSKYENKTLTGLSGITDKDENNAKRNFTKHLSDDTDPITQNKKCLKDFNFSIIGGSYRKNQMENETNDYNDFIPPMQSTAVKKCLPTSSKEIYIEKENLDPEYQDQFDITIAPQIDISHYVHNDIDEDEDEFIENDPFSTSQIEGLLNSTDIQGVIREEPNYFRLCSSIFPNHSKLITLGKVQYKKEKQLGKGAYATVYKCFNLNTKKYVAIKVSSETNAYEFYMVRTIHNRMKMRIPSNMSSVVDSVMKIHCAYYFNNGCALITDHHEHGTLLDMINVGIKRTGIGKKPLSENLTVLITMELLFIFHYLHHINIIHADVKADNILIKSLKGIIKCHSAKHYIEQSKCTICELIDFGRAIDKESYEDNQEFNVVIKNAQCIEMKMKKPWTYQIDLFGLLGIIHTMLFGKYMNVKYNNNKWTITNSFCSRLYQHSEIWNELFNTLLNIESCDNIPSILPFISKFKKSFLASVKWNDLVSECKLLSTKLLLK